MKMTLHKNSSSSRSKKTQALLVLFVVFIIYCIYSISHNLPSSSLSSNATTANNKEDNTLPFEQNNQYIAPKSDVCTTDQVLRNVDPNHTNAHIEFWRHLSTNTAQIYRKRWQKFISSVKRTPIPPTFEGKGIVLVAGNKDTFERTLTAIKLLRHMHHCGLDIEVWHLSDEQPSVAIRNELESLGAVPKDLSDPQLVRPIIHRRDAEKQ
jgi:hypothetical protein